MVANRTLIAVGPTAADREAASPPDQPIPANGNADGPKVCTKCQAENAATADRCASCQTWLKGNQAARKHGTFARHHPADVIMTADELLEGLVADKGGAAEMSTLQRSLAAKLRDTDILLSLNKRTVIAEGVDAPAGRKAHDRYLAALDRFVRLAAMLGLDREAKRVDLARALSGMR
jgi:hypothetical protein